MTNLKIGSLSRQFYFHIINIRYLIFLVVIGFSGITFSNERIVEKKYFDGFIDVDNSLSKTKMFFKWEGIGHEKYHGNEIALRLNIYFKGVLSEYTKSGEIIFKKCSSKDSEINTSCVNDIELSEDYLNLIDIFKQGFKWNHSVKDVVPESSIVEKFTKKGEKNSVTHCFDYQNYNVARGWKYIQQVPYLLLPMCKSTLTHSGDKLLEKTLVYIAQDELKHMVDYFTEDLPGNIWKRLDLDKEVPYINKGGLSFYQSFEVFQTSNDNINLRNYINIHFYEALHYSMRPHIKLSIPYSSDDSHVYKEIIFKYCSDKEIEKKSKKCSSGGTKINKSYKTLKNELKRSIKLSEVALVEDIKSKKALKDFKSMDFNNNFSSSCGSPWQLSWWNKWNPFLIVDYEKYIWVPTKGGICADDRIYIPLSTQKKILDFLTDELPGTAGRIISNNRLSKERDRLEKEERAKKLLDGI